MTPDIPDWQTEALCAQVGGETFFPEKGDSNRGAKAVCAACDVREQCLAYALDGHEEFGIWGGKTLRERRQIAKDAA